MVVDSRGWNVGCGIVVVVVTVCISMVAGLVVIVSAVAVVVVAAVNAAARSAAALRGSGCPVSGSSPVIPATRKYPVTMILNKKKMNPVNMGTGLYSSS